VSTTGDRVVSRVGREFPIQQPISFENSGMSAPQYRYPVPNGPPPISMPRSCVEPIEARPTAAISSGRNSRT
jgi:hypothetical protein